MVKTVLFAAFSFKLTLSARMTFVTMRRPAQPMPWSALPTRNIANAEVGAAAQRTLQSNIEIAEDWMAA